MDRRRFERLYNVSSRGRREARIEALHAVQPPEFVIPDLDRQLRASAEETRTWGTSHGLDAIDGERHQLREIWQRGLDETRTRELARLPDPETAHAGILGALRATLFREVRFEEIPPALAVHDSIARIIMNGHGWLIPTYEMSLSQHVTTEFREYQLTCTMIGQPIVRNVHRIMEILFEQILVQHILRIVGDGRIPTRDLQFALVLPTMGGVIDFIVERRGGIVRDAGGFGFLSTTMEVLANPRNLSNLGSVVADMYECNLTYDRDVTARFRATAEYLDGEIQTAQFVEAERLDEGGGRGRMPIADYRQIPEHTVFETITEEDLIQHRARPFVARPFAEVRARVDERPDRVVRRDRIMEIEELPKSRFNPIIKDNPACMMCLEETAENGDVVNVACRHPVISGKCGAAYHAGCFEKWRRVADDFHCLGCFVGRGHSSTQFRLLYTLRNPISPAEAAENEAYDEHVHALASRAEAVAPIAEDRSDRESRPRDEEEEDNRKKRRSGGTYKNKRYRKRTFKK
jgi:hypothetical protein